MGVDSNALEKEPAGAAVVAVNAAVTAVNAAVAAAKSVHFTKKVYTLGWGLVAISIKQHEIVW